MPPLPHFASLCEGAMEKAREAMLGEGAGALLVSNLPNVRRLCGFTGSNGLLLITENDALFFTDPRYTLQAGRETACVEVREEKVLHAAAAAFMGERGVKRAAFEGGNLAYASFRKLTGLAPGVEFIDIGEKISEIRKIKSAGEIEKMKEAARLAEEAFLIARKLVKSGIAEREVARAWNVEVAARGGAPSFDVIVAGGPNGAMPHAKPGERVFKEGDLVVFDFGASLDGYASDETVTLPVGRVGAKEAEVYDAVLSAQRAAIDAVKAGKALSDIDKTARGNIENKGYGKFFTHGTGHGVGLEIHEAPTVNFSAGGVLAEGMVFTVEPGVYLEGEFGVRIEDTVAIAGEGAQFITSLPKELYSL